MKPTPAFAAAVAVVLSTATGPPATRGTVDPKLTARFERDVRALASDDMEGRGLATRGIGRAADWIERRLKELRLEPAFAGSYRQPFPVKTGVREAAGNDLAGASSEDWTPLACSSSGQFSGDLAFVGYGIEAPPLSYQELSAVELRGKVALMLRYEPQEKDEASRFDGRRPSRWSAIRYKVHRARELGAVAVVFVTGPLQEEQDRLPVLANDGPESAAGIPVIQVKRSLASKWLESARIDLLEFQKTVDRDVKPRSVGSVGVEVSGRVALDATYAQTVNVAAKLPGKGKRASETIVIGAHYDHLGYGGNGSMKPNERAIHNGADDNASGTAAVLAAAERLRELVRNTPNRRTVFFVLFSGEEAGLAGSSYFVAHAPVPLERIRAMVNLDMVGQLRDDQLIAFGAESAPEWTGALESTAKPLGLKLTSKGDGYGPSDQTAFYAAKIPVVHFFTGAHERYHTPEDDTDSLNFAGGARVAEMTARLGERLALGTLSPRYAIAAAAPAMQGDSRGYGAYLGTIPDYRAMEDSKGGVLLGDVRPGGPAALAGIRGGDRIVEMAGTKIENLYDMTFALQDHKPGETIDVVVLRGGQRVTLRATLGARRGTEPGAAGPAHPTPVPSTPASSSEIRAGKPFAERFDGERHLQDLRQLTFGGENAEAYFSPDGTKLIYQSTPPGASCDQQYVMDLATGETRRVSSGKGRTTCGYFRFPQGDRIVYASTEAAGAECPPPPDRSKGYVWAVYAGYDLYEATPDGSGARRLTQTPGYDAEATWCPKGGKLVFTSARDGDLDLYEMTETGSVKRLTNTPGYDGGAFYNPDCSEIVWRASRPTGAALAEFRDLLSKGLVRPTALELFLAKADGTSARALTSNGRANFCPYFHPDGKRIIYSSNAGSPDGREFDLWLIDRNGGAAERVTTAPGFDGFPQFSPDGKWIVWGSNRANPKGHETNLFLARWVE